MDMAEFPDVRLPSASEGPSIKKVNYTHDAVIDQILAQPGITQKQLAAQFGYTQAWLSIVMSSDAFRERLVERKAEVVDPTLTITIEERLRGITTRGLEVLQEKLSVPAPDVSDNLVLKAIELGAKGLSVGGFGPQKVEVPPQAIAAEERLTRLAERLGRFVRVAREEVTVDAEIVQESQAA